MIQMLSPNLQMVDPEWDEDDQDHGWARPRPVHRSVILDPFHVVMDEFKLSNPMNADQLI